MILNDIISQIDPYISFFISISICTFALRLVVRLLRDNIYIDSTLPTFFKEGKTTKIPITLPSESKTPGDIPDKGLFDYVFEYNTKDGETND